ncbi:MAG: pyruvate kinase [Pirellulaceae bacterium]|nr:pyruvate kinase [Pirellulaceae bacterium]
MSHTSSRKPRTKIVATVGPACGTVEMLRALIDAGVDVFRINTAHGTREEHQATLDSVRQASEMTNQPVGVLVDLAGPKIRLGKLLDDPTQCELDQEFRFVRGDTSAAANELICSYVRLVDELKIGDRVMLADGTVSMQVTALEAGAAVCRVTGAGILRSRQGVNLPGVTLTVPAMTEADLDNVKWAAQAGADFISLSFVRSPDEVIQLKQLVQSFGSSAMTVAKIEKAEAMSCLEDIVLAADAVMVARGDLGVEIELAETPMAQKRIVSTCQRLAKPVIVATQMLDSMQHSPRPTRAEVSDVANAILDGADACMLSGETAIGDFPRESVEMMNCVMQATEATMATPENLMQRPASGQAPTPALSGVHPISAATVRGAVEIASQLHATMVVITSRSGATARFQAKFRQLTRVVGISDSVETLRQMSLFWGITPLPGAPAGSGPELREFIESWGKQQKRLAKGDCVVYLIGSAVVKSAHNVVVVQEVE